MAALPSLTRNLNSLLQALLEIPCVASGGWGFAMQIIIALWSSPYFSTTSPRSRIYCANFNCSTRRHRNLYIASETLNIVPHIANTNRRLRLFAAETWRGYQVTPSSTLSSRWCESAELSRARPKTQPIHVAPYSMRWFSLSEYHRGEKQSCSGT